VKNIRRYRRRVAVATAALLLGTPMISQGIDLPTAAASPAGPTPTVPSSPNGDPALDENNGIATIAKMRGTSIEEARSFIRRQNVLTSFADDFRKNNTDFVDFGLTPDGANGDLVLAPGSMARQRGRIPTTLNLRVREARISRDEQSRQNAILARDLASDSPDEILDVSFDFLSDQYVVATRSPAKVKQTESKLRAKGLNSRVVAGVGEDAFGGKTMFKNGAFACTSGFGVYNGSTGQAGYMTAAHCQGSGTQWSVNGATSTSVADVQWGGYQDHQVVIAGNASWLVAVNWAQVGAGFEVTQDMAATPTQVYLNTTYCNYSPQSHIQSCGKTVITNASFPNGTLAWGTDTARCKGGDSGGPFWQPVPGGESKPAGLIKGVWPTDTADALGRKPCYFMKLLDQWLASPFSLL
jgi:hypothetical protein